MKFDNVFKSLGLAVLIAFVTLLITTLKTNIPFYYFLIGWVGATIYQTIMNFQDKGEIIK